MIRVLRPNWPGTALAVAALPKPFRPRLDAYARSLADIDRLFQDAAASGGKTLIEATERFRETVRKAAPNDPVGALAEALQKQDAAGTLLEIAEGASLDIVRLRYRDRAQLAPSHRKLIEAPIDGALALLGADVVLRRDLLAALSHGIGEAERLANVGHDLDRGVIYFPQRELEENLITELALAKRRAEGIVAKYFRHRHADAKESLDRAAKYLAAQSPAEPMLFAAAIVRFGLWRLDFLAKDFNRAFQPPKAPGLLDRLRMK